MVIYSGAIVLDDTMTLGTARSVEETLRGIGRAVPGLERILFRIEAEDLWLLRQELVDLQYELNSYNVELEIDRSNITYERETLSVIDVLREELEDLLRNGYQPMYNGRPSCPFCNHFVDSEETHADDCALVAALSPSITISDAEVPKPRRARRRKESD
jgi:hypothetical protein